MFSEVYITYSSRETVVMVLNALYFLSLLSLARDPFKEQRCWPQRASFVLTEMIMLPSKQHWTLQKKSGLV